MPPNVVVWAVLLAFISGSYCVERHAVILVCVEMLHAVQQHKHRAGHRRQ